MNVKSFCIRLWFISSLIFLNQIDLNAQSRDNDPWAEEKVSIAKKGTFGRLQVGGSFINIETMNLALENLGYEPFSKNFLALGLGFSRFKKKWLFNAEMYNYMLRESAYNNQLAIINFHYLTTSIGYLAYRQENSLFVYPSVGVGGGITNLKVRAQDEQYHTAFFGSGTLADFALNVKHYSEIQDGKGNSLEVGFTLGYLHAIGDQFNFRNLVPDQTVSASPSGIYFRLSLGMGKMK